MSGENTDDKKPGSDVLFTITRDHIDTGMRGFPVGTCPISDVDAVKGLSYGGYPIAQLADLDKVNPGSVVLSAVMMLDHLGWSEAARAIETALEKTIGAKTVTYDFARLMDGATEVKCSEFGRLVAEAI